MVGTAAATQAAMTERVRGVFLNLFLFLFYVVVVSCCVLAYTRSTVSFPLCVRACVCVCDRQTETKRDRRRETETQRERENSKPLILKHSTFCPFGPI